MALTNPAVKWSFAFVICVTFIAGFAARSIDARTGHHVSEFAWKSIEFAQSLSIRTPEQSAPGPQPLEPLPRHEIETILLPVVTTTFTIPMAIGLKSGPGGGITAVGDIIFITDLSGTIAWIVGNNALKLSIPPIPNHIEQYSRSVETISSRASNLRVHDIESKREAHGIRLFVSYEKFLPELNTTSLAVSSILVDVETFLALGNWQEVYLGQQHTGEKYFPTASGGRMFITAGTLYLTVGDYNLDNILMTSGLEAQNPNTDFGKILSIDLATGTKTRLTMGHRNPRGLTVTSKGTVYATEHGPRGGDTLTEITQGKNFGWPIKTLGMHYTTFLWPNRNVDSADKRFDAPVFAWLPSIAPSNLIKVANFHPAWNGDLLVASLRARSLFRLRQDEHGRVLYSEAIWIGSRLRDIVSLDNGTLAMWTEDAQLITLTVDADRLAANTRVEEPITGMLSRCERCHHVGPTNRSHAAPSFSKMVGRRIAGDAFERYSPALGAMQGNWSEQNLLSFLTDPTKFVGGAPMDHPTQSKERAAAIIDLLKLLN